MIIDGTSITIDMVFISGTHKHEGKSSLMICQRSRTWYEYLEDTNMESNDHTVDDIMMNQNDKVPSPKYF